MTCGLANETQQKDDHRTHDTLHDGCHDQLLDLHSACSQSLEATTALGRAATDKALSKALIAGAAGISESLEKLKSICAEHGIEPKGERCKGMEGLVQKVYAHAIDADVGDNDVRKAMIIAQYQRMVHDANAGYGTLHTYANRLGFHEQDAILQQMLDDTFGGDLTMTKPATSGINRAAAA